MVTLLPHTSEIKFTSQPQVGKLVVASHWLAVAAQNLGQLYVLVSSSHKITDHDMTLNNVWKAILNQSKQTCTEPGTQVQPMGKVRCVGTLI